MQSSEGVSLAALDSAAENGLGGGLAAPEAARQRGDAARLRSDAARLRGEAARLHGEAARLHGEAARQHGEAAHLRVVQGGRSLPLRSRVGQSAGVLVRRLVEGTAATLLLLTLSPLLLTIALVVRLDSGGPALFRQRRLGRGRREFTVFKFRTMRAGADVAPHREYVQSLIQDDRGPERGRLYKLSVDDRVTRVGRLLRSWSLDELPQLINVLRGEMAFVGPRPVIPYEVDMYPAEYLRRFDVRPGLTGLWQVSGRNERSYEEMVRLDIEYAAHATPWRDLQILLKTVPVVLRRQGVA